MAAAADDSNASRPRQRMGTGELNELLGEVDDLLDKRPAPSRVSDTLIQAAPVFVLELQIEGTEHSCVVGTSPVIIGRAPHCNLVVESPDVSREHAVVKRLANASYVIEDRGSSNGTWIGEDQVKSREVRDGDIYRIGTTNVVASIRSS